MMHCLPKVRRATSMVGFLSVAVNRAVAMLLLGVLSATLFLAGRGALARKRQAHSG